MPCQVREDNGLPRLQYNLNGGHSVCLIFHITIQQLLHLIELEEQILADPARAPIIIGLNVQLGSRAAIVGNDDDALPSFYERQLKVSES